MFEVKFGFYMYVIRVHLVYILILSEKEMSKNEKCNHHHLRANTVQNNLSGERVGHPRKQKKKEV